MLLVWEIPNFESAMGKFSVPGSDSVTSKPECRVTAVSIHKPKLLVINCFSQNSVTESKLEGAYNNILTYSTTLSVYERQPLV